MGYPGKLQTRHMAIHLRSRGLSVIEIQHRLKVSRSSVSIWVRDVELTDEQKRRLHLNSKTGQLKGSIIAAENKKRRRALEEKRLLEEGKREVGVLSKREFFIAGVSLYFAEGDKRGGNVSFSNSDPRAITFMMKWLREILHVTEDKFRGYLYIHDNLDVEKSKKFWSNLTKIPLQNFNKSYIVKNNKNRLRKVKHPYGVFRISVSNVKLLRKILGWVDGVLDDSVI